MWKKLMLFGALSAVMLSGTATAYEGGVLRVGDALTSSWTDARIDHFDKYGIYLKDDVFFPDNYTSGMPHDYIGNGIAIRPGDWHILLSHDNVSYQEGKIKELDADGTEIGDLIIMPAGVVPGPILLHGDNNIYVGCNDGSLYAVSSAGSVQWTFATGSSVISSPALAADGTIYVGSVDSSIYAVNPDGSQAWEYETPGAVRSSPAIDADGNVYVGSYDYYVYSLTSGGVLRWTFETQGRVESSPAIASDGTLYVGSDDGRLYAVGS